MAPSASNNTLSVAPSADGGLSPSAQPTRSTSAEPAATAASPVPEKSAAPADATTMAKTESKVSLQLIDAQPNLHVADVPGWCRSCRQSATVRWYRARTSRSQEAIYPEERA